MDIASLLGHHKSSQLWQQFQSLISEPETEIVEYGIPVINYESANLKFKIANQVFAEIVAFNEETDYELPISLFQDITFHNTRSEVNSAMKRHQAKSDSTPSIHKIDGRFEFDIDIYEFKQTRLTFTFLKSLRQNSEGSEQEQKLFVFEAFLLEQSL